MKQRTSSNFLKQKGGLNLYTSNNTAQDLEDLISILTLIQKCLIYNYMRRGFPGKSTWKGV